MLAAYAKAAENNGLDHFKTMLAEHAKALEKDAEEREERAAKKASKKSRKSEATVPAEDADGMDVDEEAATEKPKSKKRKKADDSEDADEKVRLDDYYLTLSLTITSLQRLRKQQQS